MQDLNLAGTRGGPSRGIHHGTANEEEINDPEVLTWKLHVDFSRMCRTGERLEELVSDVIGDYCSVIYIGQGPGGFQRRRI
jgi:hypothetical protein